MNTSPPTRVHVHKGGVHHFVPRAGDGRFHGDAVDVPALTAILEVDIAARTCTADPGATFAEVVRRTLKDGLLPKVVPELEGITLGGAVAGCSVESMSYRYGAHAAGLADQLMIDCAVYGRRNGGPEDLSALLEDKTYELGGMKTLISDNHHTPERFWQIYNRPAWESAKASLDPAGRFSGLYEKFHAS